MQGIYTQDIWMTGYWSIWNIILGNIILFNFVLAPPSFEEKTVRLSVRKGEKANLICEASGDSPMDVFWRRNGMPISESEDAR